MENKFLNKKKKKSLCRLFIPAKNESNLSRLNNFQNDLFFESNE